MDGRQMTEIDRAFVSSMLLDRDQAADKRAFGHALLIVGSEGMMGAAVLSVGAALRSGCGLVTAHIPAGERMIMHVTAPAAIVDSDPGTAFSEVPDNLHYYTAIGAGCGLGRSETTVRALSSLLSLLRDSGQQAGVGTGRDSVVRRPGLVLDADALNIIASHPDLALSLPPGSVLTPHTRELSRLVPGLAGVSDPKREPDFPHWKYPWAGPELDCVAALAGRLSSVVIVKGHRTLVCCPDIPVCTGMDSGTARRGPVKLYVNTTGNPGMAKGGSGDVLTGLITGLLARGYSPLEAALLGVWYHGRAGDDAAGLKGEESMNASDIMDNIRIL